MLPPLEETLVPLDPLQPEMKALELDELWSFVLRRSEKVWVWLALCRATRQIVACVTGDRSAETAQQLWDAIPPSYREEGHAFTDFWEAYAKVLPSDQHTAGGKETGMTAHIERWNNTLRQRLARFVRKTLSFSKSHDMHEACLLLFIHRYNREKALLWKRLHPS